MSLIDSKILVWIKSMFWLQFIVNVIWLICLTTDECATKEPKVPHIVKIGCKINLFWWFEIRGA